MAKWEICFVDGKHKRIDCNWKVFRIDVILLIFHSCLNYVIRIMAQKPEDFNLPISAISKIVKDAIPEGVRVTDVAKLALSKAASVFVLFATSSANSLSQDAKRKRLLAKDVFDALNDLELDFLIPPLHNALTAYRNSLETKKQAKIFKKNDSQKSEPGDVEMDVSGPDVITLESDSESEKEDSNNEIDSETLRKTMDTKKIKTFKKNDSTKGILDDIHMVTSQAADVITLESDSESEDDSSNDSESGINSA